MASTWYVTIFFNVINASQMNVKYRSTLQTTCADTETSFNGGNLFLTHVTCTISTKPTLCRGSSLLSFSHRYRDWHRGLCVGPIGEKLVRIQSCPLDTSFSLTLMISLNEDHPVSYTFREASNTAEDFATFLVWLLVAGRIQPGDGNHLRIRY